MRASAEVDGRPKMDEMDWDPTSPRRLQPPQQSACPALRGMAHNQGFSNSPPAYYDSLHAFPSSSWSSYNWNAGSYPHHRSVSSSDPFQATPHALHASRLPFGYQGPHDPQVNSLHGGFGPSGFGYSRPAQQYVVPPPSSSNHPFQMDLPFGASPMGPGSSHSQHAFSSGAPVPTRDQSSRRSSNDRSDFSGGFAGRHSSSSPQRRGAPAFYSPPRAPESNIAGEQALTLFTPLFGSLRGSHFQEPQLLPRTRRRRHQIRRRHPGERRTPGARGLSCPEQQQRPRAWNLLIHRRWVSLAAITGLMISRTCAQFRF